MEVELLVLQIVAIQTGVDGNCSRHSFGFLPGWAGAQQVEDLGYVEKQGDAGHDEHEDDEDGLLGGSRHVALDSEGTRSSGADDSWVHDEPVQIILAHDEPDLQEDSEKYGGHVGSQQVAFNRDVAFVVSVLGTFDDSTSGVLLHVFSQLLLFVDNMEDVTEVDERWRGDEDNLKDPESNVWDREGFVVADVLATGLFGVADHIRLFVTPHLQRSEEKWISLLIHAANGLSAKLLLW